MNDTRPTRGRSTARMASALLGAMGLVVGPMAAAAEADTPPPPPAVMMGPASSITTTGAVVTASVNPEGTDTLYQIQYGPAGGALTSMTGNQDAGAGNATVNLPVVLEGLTPNTSYSYRVSAFVNATGTPYTGDIATFTTSPLPTGAPQPILPPNDPPGNAIFDGTCATDAACVSDVNGARAAQENLGPLTLPSNWSTLTGAEQLFVFTNLERTSRGEPAIADLINTYDASVQTGVQTDMDPVNNLAGVWGQGATPTAAMYGWIYADGLSATPGAGNTECTATGSAGCWGHRNVLLSDSHVGSFSFGNPNEMDAVAGTDNNGQPSYAASLTVDPNPPAAGSGSLVYTWAAEQPFPGATGNPTGPLGLKAPEGKVCNGCAPPLVYGGGSVMGTPATVGEATVTPIFWSPSDAAPYSAGYTKLINGYVTDVAAASGSTDNVYSVNTEYYQAVKGQNGNTQNSNIQYLVHAGAGQNDANSYPTGGVKNSGCDPDAGYTSCVTDAQLQAELTSYLAANNLPTDLSHLYPVFLAPGVETVDSSGGSSAAAFCGYHDSYKTAGGGQVLYANEPYPNLEGCRSGQAPNGDKFADAAIDTLSHEINETITDPSSGGWGDSAMPGNENADECASAYGTPIDSTDPANAATTRYNQVIGTGKYYTQEEFSNAAYAKGQFSGCVQSEDQATAPVNGPAADGGAGQVAGAARHVGTAAVAPASLNQVNVDSTVYTVAADGKDTATVTASVSDANGDPVAGDDVSLITANLDGNRALCGTVNNPQGTTDVNGDLVVTYTASADNVSCDVVATEGRTGQSSDVQIDQGTAAANAPSLDVNFPSAVTAGAPPVTFTATSTNPSAQGLPNTRFDVIITGDNTATTGVDASHIHLSANVGPQGQFVNVPLSGTTKGDGEIDGYLPPEKGYTYPAGGKLTTTFKVSVDANAPTAATTKTPLTAEADFDQIQPADGFNNTLDYSIADIPVVAPVPVPPVTPPPTTLPPTTPPPTTPPVHLPPVPPLPAPSGYELVAADGGVFTHGDAGYHGSEGGAHLNASIVGTVATPDGGGYWLVARDGGVFTFGDAGYHGSEGNAHLNAPIVGMAATPDGGGYWLVGADGGVFTFGDAGYHGSEGNAHLNAPIVGMAATPDGGGYWLVAADGGVFTHGDAGYHGSEGAAHLNAPIVGMAAAGLRPAHRGPAT